MKKVCFCPALELSNFGDSTRITEIWKRMPELLNARVYMVSFREDKRLSNIKDLNLIRLPTLFFSKRIRFVSKFLSHIFVVSYFCFLSNLALVYECQSMLNILGLLISKIKKVPLIYEVNSILELEKYEKEKTFLTDIITKIAKFTEKQTVKQASKITVVTPELKEIFHKEYNIPIEKIEVVPNGADIDLFYPMDKLKCRKELNLDQNKLIVCFVGGMGMGCGAKNIVEAAPYILKQVPNTHFLIVGDGPYRTIMEEKIHALSLQDNFIFTGAVPHEVVPKYINASDVCMALFKDERIKKVGGGSCIKLYEYLACGKPVIGTAGLSTFEILTKYKSGIVVNPENPQGISNSLISLLKNKKFREEMGGNGRKIIEGKYNWDFLGKQVAGICEGEIKINDFNKFNYLSHK